ncbi:MULTISPECIES: hypothetical protein [unclassified Streptomyces]|uniref:hypothetical protein n=1 Tax=unclassified Streptomyces TaxID=2593676 RepID=UPI00336AEBAD
MSSQQPAPAPIPPDAAPASPAAPAPRKSPRALAAALIVGVLIGGAGVGVAWAVSGDTSSSNDAAGDARDACRALNGLDTSKYTDDGPQGDVARNRFGAAIALSAAAAGGDATYKPLAEALLMAQNQHARTFDFGNSAVKKNLDKAHQICDDLD